MPAEGVESQAWAWLNQAAGAPGSMAKLSPLDSSCILELKGNQSQFFLSMNSLFQYELYFYKAVENGSTFNKISMSHSFKRKCLGTL